MFQIFTQKLCLNEYDLTFTAMKIKRLTLYALASDEVCIYADGRGFHPGPIIQGYINFLTYPHYFSVDYSALFSMNSIN